MLNEKTYENFWELFDTIPSLKKQGAALQRKFRSLPILIPDVPMDVWQTGRERF